MQQNQLHTMAAAAHECGLSRQLVSLAVKRGDIPVYYTACRHPLVRLQDVRSFAQDRPRRGRPTKRGT